MNTRGEGKTNLILALLVTAVIVVGGLRVVPVYIRSYEFKDAVRSQCKFAGVDRKPHEVVRDTLFKKAKELDLPIRREDIRISDSPGGLHITTQFAVPVDLFVYRTSISFAFDEDTRTAY